MLSFLKRTLFFLALLVAVAAFATSCTIYTTYEVLTVEEVEYEEVLEEEPPAPPPEIEEHEEPEPEPEECLLDEEQIEAFDELLEESFIDFVSSCIISLNSYIRNPELYGITDVPVTWEGFITTGVCEENIEESWEWIENFETFDREALTPLQQQSYDILAWRVESSLISLEIPMYYYRSALQGSNGVHVLLPILLDEFYFYNQQDLDNYLQLLSEIHVVFDDAILLEEIRIGRGFALTDRILDAVIEEAEGFIDNLDNNTLLTSFEFRMRGVDFLTEEEILEYIQQNHHIFLNYVVPAYENLIQDLEGLRGDNGENLGLAHSPHGRTFYRLRYRAIGSSYTPEEWFDIFDQRFREVCDLYLELWWQHPDAMDEYLNMDIHDSGSPEELVAFQFEQSLSSFPSLPEGISYTINRMDESLGGFAAGFYMIPQLDNYLVNVIYYNPDFADNNEFMYSLMAHEALGHMLQFTTVFHSDLPYFRKINTLGFNGNIEGWAMHAQLYAYNFLDLSEVNHSRLVVWDEFSTLYGAIIDLGVHYLGWTLEETIEYLNSIHFLTFHPDEIFEDSFYTAIRNPGRAIPYAIGLIEMRRLQEHFEDLLGNDFDMRTFNEVFLSKGPAPFPLVRSWMEDTFDEFGFEFDETDPGEGRDPRIRRIRRD